MTTERFYLSEDEQKVLDLLRDLKPFERIEIKADASGEIKNCLVHRSQKIVLKQTD